MTQIQPAIDWNHRFWSRVAPEALSGCWMWMGYIHPDGYGSLRVRGAASAAHREAYRLAVGPIPDGMVVMHRCDVRCCVNPAHLAVGTQQENVDDMDRKGRRRSHVKHVVRWNGASVPAVAVARQLGVTPSTVIDRMKAGAPLDAPMCGSKTRLTAAQLADIRGSGDSLSALAARHGVDRSYVCRLRSGKITVRLAT